METFDGRVGKRLSTEIIGDLRLFAFYIGNRSILSGTDLGYNYNIEIIFTQSEVLGNIFAIKLFRYYDERGNQTKSNVKIGKVKSSSDLIGEYIQSLNENLKFPLFFEKLQSPTGKNWRDVIVRFFRDLGRRNLQTAPLKDYNDWIIDEGDYMEKAAAIFCNVLRLDKEFNAINEEWARYRTSQYIRLMNDDSDTYEVKPPFKEWELTLWM